MLLRATMNALKISCSRFLSNRNIGLLTINNRNFYVAAVLWEKSYYEILRVHPNATQSEIKEAYYRLSKIYHPDIRKDDQALNMFRSITEAYDTLSNLQARKFYDKGLGKDIPYDSLNEPFYSTMFGYKLNKGPIKAAEYDKILNKKSSLDEFLDQEYHDRKAEYQTYRKGLHEHMIQNYGTFGTERVLLAVVTSMGFLFWTYCEYHISKRSANEATKDKANLKSVLKELWEWRFPFI